MVPPRSGRLRRVSAEPGPMSPSLRTANSKILFCLKTRTSWLTIRSKRSGVSWTSRAKLWFSNTPERQLLRLFWHWLTLKHMIQRMMVEDHYFQEPAIVSALADALNWLSKTTSGRLITTFMSDVGNSEGKHDRDSAGRRQS